MGAGRARRRRGSRRLEPRDGARTSSATSTEQIAAPEDGVVLFLTTSPAVGSRGPPARPRRRGRAALACASSGCEYRSPRRAHGDPRGRGMPSGLTEILRDSAARCGHLSVRRFARCLCSSLAGGRTTSGCRRAGSPGAVAARPERPFSSRCGTGVASPRRSARRRSPPRHDRSQTAQRSAHRSTAGAGPDRGRRRQHDRRSPAGAAAGVSYARTAAEARLEAAKTNAEALKAHAEAAAARARAQPGTGAQPGARAGAAGSSLPARRAAVAASGRSPAARTARGARAARAAR